jgi:CRP-like cAMP-binding protein
MRGSLKHISLFRDLPEEALDRAARSVQEHRFRKGAALFEQGQRALTVWLIRKGWVHLVKRTPAGTSATIFTITPDELLCGVSAAAGEGAYYASAIAATDTVALGIPQAVFAGLLAQEPGFAGRVLAIYHARMRHMAESISLAQAPVEQRLAYVLLRLRGAFGATIPITHHELARMAATRWETSIRTLSSMKQRGWIATARGRVTILHPKDLQNLLARQENGITKPMPVGANGH